MTQPFLYDSLEVDLIGLTEINTLLIIFYMRFRLPILSNQFRKIRFDSFFSLEREENILYAPPGVPDSEWAVPKGMWDSG